MEKIIVLGTGNAIALDYFNTCFILEDDKENYFLVDTGGGNDILRQLKKANVDLLKIHNIFISHKHIDHSYGLLWIFRLINMAMKEGKYEGNLNIYCHNELVSILRTQIQDFLKEGQRKFLDKRIFFNIINDGEKFNVLNYELEAIDIKAKGDKQFGFKTILNNGKSLMFAGDEPLAEELYSKVENIDWLLHEAFCLENETEKFKAKERNHDTVKAISIKADKLKVKNLVLWHSYENLGANRKEIYTKESQQYYKGNVYVPNDLDEIIL